MQHTCPYIDDVIETLETIHDELQEYDTEPHGTISRVRAYAMNACNTMEQIRNMNAELRDEGEVFAEEADKLEALVVEWQEIANHAEERIEELEEKIFDAEKEEARWQEYSLTQLSLLTGS